MACPSPISPTTIISLTLLLLSIFLPCCVLSSDSASMEDCVPRLLQLAPCAPFVRGSSTSPTTSCCDNLDSLYMQQPACLCALLNDTTTFPINYTLALQLPLLCNLQANSSACAGSGPPEENAPLPWQFLQLFLPKPIKFSKLTYLSIPFPSADA